MSKRFLIVLVAVAVVFGGIFWLTRNKANAPSTSNGSGKAQATEHIRNKGSTGVVLLEYGDFQCPACGAFYPIIKQLETNYGSKVSFQFRHFPLTNIHQNALAGARAAEAAGKQGKFFEMHDILYQENGTYYDAQQQGKTYNTWINSSNPLIYFADYATQLSINVDKFRADFASSEINDIINADIQAGQAIGTSATPTFVLDGKKLEQNPPSYDAFAKVLDEAIKQKSGQ